MNEPYIIALDQGTSSCRALAVDVQGRVFAQEQRVFSPQRTSKGRSEYDGAALLEAQVAVLHGLLDRIGPQHAAAIAVCSQRSTVVLWDKKNRGSSSSCTYVGRRPCTEAKPRCFPFTRTSSPVDGAF